MLIGHAAENDGTTVHKLTVGAVPVDGFWSISLYDAKGYFEPNKCDAYTVNNLTAQKDANGLMTIQFGDCDGKIPNCLPIMQGWNYTVRLSSPACRNPERQVEISRAAASSS